VVEPFTGRATHEVSIEASRVVLAAGCMASPTLLQRSGLEGPSGQVGKNLLGHPGYAVMGIYDHEIDPWDGATQGYHSLHFLEEGMKLEVLWAPPAVLAMRFPGFGLELKERLLGFSRMAPFDVIVHAKHSKGSVRPRRGSFEPDIRFDLDDRDVALLHRGIVRLAELCRAAGAVEVLPGVHGAPAVVRTDADMEALRNTRMGADAGTVGMNHTFGSARMGRDPRTSAVDVSGKCHHLDNVWIADTSIFPDSPAVNPMLTCMALAHRIAAGMA
jgi:choline dehydrogenase-like flavoprotein